jgi:hypothetical protein
MSNRHFRRTHSVAEGIEPDRRSSRHGESMQLHTPPSCQGQIVTVSYGWVGGDLIRVTADASDQSRVIRRLRDPWSETEQGSTEASQLDGWDAWNEAPPDWLEALLDEAPEITEAQLDRLCADE